MNGNSNYPTGINLSKVNIFLVSLNNESLKFYVFMIGLLYNEEFDDELGLSFWINYDPILMIGASLIWFIA